MEDYLHNLNIKIPKAAKEMIDKMINSDEIKEIVEGINEHRPPRLALIGRSGVGKSSLINALTSSYLAETSAVEVGTKDADVYTYEKDEEVIFEIIDTRGFEENIQVDTHSAEDELIKAIKDFEPDAFLVLNDGSDRTTLKADAKYLNELLNNMDVEIPIITAVTRVDSLEPAREKSAPEYSQKKKNNIKDKKNQVMTVLKDAGIENPVVIPVSAYVEWSHESPELLTKKEQEELTIDYDGRYNIDGLIEHLENSMEFKASLNMMMNDRIDNAIKKIAQKIVHSFSGVSAAIATTPIPVGDIFVLVPIQVVEVILIAQLKGIELDKEAAKDFIISLGGVALVGLGLRFVAQQGTKFLNLAIVGSGSAVSAGVAYSGTYSIGQAAIKYYLEDKSKEEIDIELNKPEELEKEKPDIEDGQDIKTNKSIKKEKKADNQKKENKFFINTKNKIKNIFKKDKDID